MTVINSIAFSRLRQHRLTRFVWVGLLLLISFTGARAERLPVRIYTSADGLGSSFVDSMMRDSHGFLWFCTRDGLSRFDGQRFTTYQLGDKNAPTGIEQIVETRQGVYWIVTTSGLYRFDPRRVSTAAQRSDGRITLNAAFVSENRGHLYEDQDGKLWLGSDALYTVEETNGIVELRRVELNLPNIAARAFSIFYLEGGKDGSLWLCTTQGLGRRLPDGRMVFFTIANPLTNQLISVKEDNAGHIWMTRASDIYVIKPEALSALNNAGGLTARDLDAVAQPQPQPNGQAVRLPERAGDIFRFSQMGQVAAEPYRSAYKSADGHIWVPAGNALLEFDGIRFRAYTAAQGLTISMFKASEDAAGNLWLSGSGGVVRYNRQGLSTYQQLAVASFYEDQAHDLYAVNGPGRIARWDGQSFATRQLRVAPEAKSSWHSKAALLDSRGEWWVLTTDKLYRFAAARDFASLARQRPLAVFMEKDGFAGNSFYQIFEDKRGTLWVSAKTQGHAVLARWNRLTEKFQFFSAADGLPPDNAVSAFAEAADGTLWLGFVSGGLAKFADGRFTQYAQADGVPAGLVTALYADAQNRLWVATSQSGLARVDDLSAATLKFVYYNAENGLSSNNVRSLVGDNFGQIYVGTVRGVDRLAPASGRVKHFTINDGLASDFVYSAFLDHAGALWFGTPNGVSRLAPEAETKAQATPAWLSGLRIAGERKAVSELGASDLAGLELAPAQNNLQIDFFGIDFNPNEALRYQYMLEGADKDWSAPGEQRTVNFSNLAAGDYRFLVRAVNAAGAVSEKPATVSFRVLPPLWARWWFITGVILLAGAGFFAFYRYRLGRLQAVNAALAQLQQAKEERLAELERVRARIARDLHDDVGSSLTQIALYSEVAKQSARENKSAVAPLEFLVNVSNELVDAMSDIVWAINPRKDHLQDLTQRMRRFASEILTTSGIDLDFVAPDAAQDVALGANIRREVFLIFKESVNNIVKHSGATEAAIEFRLAENALTLALKDNGRGFTPSANNEATAFDWRQAKGGNGLLSMHKRAVELGGSYHIASQPGSGTTVTLTVPLA